MRGFPKHFNTKQDVENALALYPGEASRRLQRLIDERFNWFPTGQVGSVEAGVTDGTHKVVRQEDADETVTYTQLEWREDPKAKLFRLGFTVEEAQALIDGIDG